MKPCGHKTLTFRDFDDEDITRTSFHPRTENFSLWFDADFIDTVRREGLEARIFLSLDEIIELAEEAKIYRANKLLKGE